MAKDCIVLDEQEQRLLERIRLDGDKREALECIRLILSKIEKEKESDQEENKAC